MRKLKDLDDLNGAAKLVRQVVQAGKLQKGSGYETSIKLYWPASGIYYLDSFVLASLVGKELSRAGLRMEDQIISCGLHQIPARAGEIEISFKKMKAGKAPALPKQEPPVRGRGNV